jgi:hypothetical protein
LLEYVRITFPSEGQRQRDTGCVITLLLGLLAEDDFLITVVTFDGFGALTVGFVVFDALEGLFFDFGVLASRLELFSEGLTAAISVLKVCPTLMVKGGPILFRAANSLKSMPKRKAMA